MTGAGAGTASRLLLGSAAAALAFTVLTVLVASGSDAVGAFDADARALADRVLGSPHGGGRTGADTFGSVLLGAAVLAVFAVLLRRRRFGAALWVLAGLTVQFAVETALGPLTERPLPLPDGGGTPEDGYGFPSGHMASATLAVLVLLLVPRTRTAAWWTGLALGALLVAAVGVSRLLADAHHATDLAGGVLLGLTVGCAVARLMEPRPPDGSGKETT
ncbi:hypothetical protein GCM10010261_49960 [Streptomyces pilosus]|uniref:phosphatase PAP2 family protein n=1 Tax=Streptomyces pilosus TaxID=28893 RepID=UPI00167AF26A|nr:phosphatase PAP2 family protein [Streptomyces pilosus]GGV61240.1 hypothetical protein GCM10010261_49960 [Streptomyces pilosus]